MSKRNRARYSILTSLDGFATAHVQAGARLRGLEDVHAPSDPTLLILTPLVASFPTSFHVASAAVPGHYGYNPQVTPFYAFVPFLPPPSGANHGSVHGLHLLEMDIDAFRMVIHYSRYSLTNRAVYIGTYANLSLQKLKRRVELLYLTLEPFSEKDPIELLAFLSTMTEAFSGQRLSEGLASRDIGYFLTGSAQTTYTNVVHPGTHDPARLPVTWPLIAHSLLSRFITDELLRNEYFAVTSASIKQGETDMYFAKRLHGMARRFRKVFSNAESELLEATTPRHDPFAARKFFVDLRLQIVTTSTESNSMIWRQGQLHTHAKPLQLPLRRCRLTVKVLKLFNILWTISP